uniref:Uncharacterized protein n=1 Tax=Anguilla anguilla TaxID=7936 RepID=A0A0E9QTK0_ANGAN
MCCDANVIHVKNGLGTSHVACTAMS